LLVFWHPDHPSAQGRLSRSLRSFALSLAGSNREERLLAASGFETSTAP
jgi:hypothetical protein